VVNYDFGSDVLQCEVPPMLLHPLVENAIKHGMRRDHRPLHVDVVGRVDDGRVVLEVRNTGSLEATKKSSFIGHGIGLTNVRERMKSLFPHDNAVSLSQHDGWVTARVEFSDVKVAA